MINYNDIKLIQPSEKMPCPNQYFFIVMGFKKVVPAILKAHTSSDMFYDCCIVFHKDGTHFKVNKKQVFGWTPMFQGTKTFQHFYVEELFKKDKNESKKDRK